MEYRNLLGKGSSKLQSAMEYLMTYGWAILIIAVVLGVLYYLGIFNGQSLTPRLQPGSCHVARTSAGVENFGVCAGLPEFVAQFNGASSYINTGTSSLGSGAVTISEWINAASVQQSGGAMITDSLYGVGTVTFWYSSAVVMGFRGIAQWQTPAQSINANTWYNVVFVYNGQGAGSASNIQIYINGISQTLSNIGSAGGATYDNYIGKDSNTGTHWFSGSIANVQIYNASLSAAEAKALYMEGIGGAPIKPANVVGWWPLNGNANDYSGNNNNGQSVNVQYTNTWLSSYSAP